MSFWDNKSVAVTGGHGFLGHHVCRALNRRGVIPYIPDYDLRVTSNVGRLYFEERPDIVIHLAASVGGLGANMKNPGSFFYDNVKMGIELMEAGRRYGVKKFVQMGSACEYPKNAPLPLKEESVWDGYPEETNAAYGISKRTLLTMGQAYRQQYGMDIIHLLSTNLYGPGDNFGENSHFIPAAIQRFAKAVKNGEHYVSMWGNGTATRDFLYVTDAAEGILLATEHYNDVEPVNLATGHEVRIHEVAQKIAWLSEFRGGILWDAMKPNGQPRRCLDVTKARAFGFEAYTSLEAGLLRTIEWYA